MVKPSNWGQYLTGTWIYDQIAPLDKPASELNVNENLKLEREYKNQIAHPSKSQPELNVKEHMNLNHMEHEHNTWNNWINWKLMQ